MADHDKDGETRLTRFLAILIFEIGEERVSRAYSKMSDGVDLLKPVSFSASLAGEDYADNILNP